MFGPVYFYGLKVSGWLTCQPGKTQLIALNNTAGKFKIVFAQDKNQILYHAEL